MQKETPYQSVWIAANPKEEANQKNMFQLFNMWLMLHNQDVWLSCFLIRCQKYILQLKSSITASLLPKQLQSVLQVFN